MTTTTAPDDPAPNTPDEQPTAAVPATDAAPGGGTAPEDRRDALAVPAGSGELPASPTDLTKTAAAPADTPAAEAGAASAQAAPHGGQDDAAAPAMNLLSKAQADSDDTAAGTAAAAAAVTAAASGDAPAAEAVGAAEAAPVVGAASAGTSVAAPVESAAGSGVAPAAEAIGSATGSAAVADAPGGPVAGPGPGPAPVAPADALAGPADPHPAAPIAAPAPGPGRRRRVARAVARWTVAVLVCGGLGAGTAYGISGMERHEVPGLATEHDGRWEFPKLGLPALPEASPRPFTKGNLGNIHHADLRRLLLPAPAGATVDKKLTGGWVSVDQYLSEHEEDYRTELEQALTDLAVRHVAARGWTMPDGTGTRIYLLRFHSAAVAQAYMDDHIGIGILRAPLTGTPSIALDEKWPEEHLVPNTSSYVYEETKPYGPEQTRQAHIIAGDTLALIVQSRKGSAPAVPFHQTVVLQNQLLG